MILSILVLLAFIIPGLGIRKAEDCDYMDKKVTSSVMGIFTLIIFFSHVTGQMGSEMWFDIAAQGIYQTLFSQMMVVPFLFYSAYGIVRQYHKQGRKKYLTNFFIQRFLKVYLIIIVCILFGLIFRSACTGFATFAFDPMLFTVWGTKYWFAFAILACYVLLFIALLAFGEKKIPFFVTITLLSVAFIVVMIVTGKETYWYNTIISFPLGAGFALIKEKFDVWMSSLKRKIVFFAISAAIYCGMLAITEFVDLYSVHVSLYVIMYSIRCTAFMASVLAFMMIFKFGNKALELLSGYAIFSYLLQDSAFVAFKHDPANVHAINIYLYMFVVLGITIALSFIVKFLYDLFFKNTLGKLKFPLPKKKKEEPNPQAVEEKPKANE